MAQLPVLLRPRYAIRRRALKNGLLGPSGLWRLIAFFIIFSRLNQRIFGKRPDRLLTRRIGVGHVITVATSAPLTRREAKRAGISKSLLAEKARADLEAAAPAS